MKSIKTLFALSALALVGLASCSGGEKQSSTKIDSSETSCECSETVCPDVHVHEPGTAYVYDDNGHWHTCSGCSKDIRFDYGAHELEEKDGASVCKVCGYTVEDVNNKLFAKVKEGIEAYSNNKDKLTTTCLVSMEENGTKMSMESKATFDFGQSFAHQQVSIIASDGGKTVASEYHLSKTGDQYYYYTSSGSSKAQKTSADYINCMYKEAIGEALPLENISVITESPSYDSVAETFQFMNGLNGNFSTEIYEKDGAVTLTITGVIYEMKDYCVSENIAEMIVTVKDGFLCGFSTNSDVKYNYLNGATGSEAYGVTATLEKKFDKEFYDSYSTDGIVESDPTDMNVDIYLGDYFFTDDSVQYGESFVNGNSAYGEVYYDKACTKKYDGAAIMSYNTTLYLKPVEVSPDDEYALIYRLTDVTYNRGKHISAVHKKKSYSIMVKGGNSYTLPWESEPTYMNQSVTVNGKDYSGYTAFAPEAGKVYTVVNTYTTYFGA